MRAGGCSVQHRKDVLGALRDEERDFQVGADKLGQVVEGAFAALQELRNDAGDAPPGIEHSARHGSHKPDRTAAIDEAYPGISHRPAENARRLSVHGIGSEARAAIDANAMNLCHAVEPCIASSSNQVARLCWP